MLGFLRESAAKSAVFCAVAVMPFLHREWRFADEVILLCVGLLLAMMIQIKPAVHRDHNYAVQWAWRLLSSGGLWIAWSYEADHRLVLMLLLAIFGCGLNCYHLHRAHAALAASREVYKYLELLREPTTADKEKLMRILGFYPPRNIDLFDEFQRGLKAKTSEARNRFLAKFYIKYDVVKLTEITSYHYNPN